jgi:hypothetical protein
MRRLVEELKSDMCESVRQIGGCAEAGLHAPGTDGEIKTLEPMKPYKLSKRLSTYKGGGDNQRK